MAGSENPNRSSQAIERERFATTQWTLVSQAAGPSSEDSALALRTLCELYWMPLYAYAKRKADSVEDAQDLTQAFFAELLEKNYVDAAERNRGKFRSFLLAAFNHFMFKQWEKKRAKKRGGGLQKLSLDFKSADSSYGLELSTDLTPEQLFDQQWAIVLLDQIFQKLRKSFVESGREVVFDRLKSFVIGDHPGVRYVDLVDDLQLSEAAIKKTVSRMRAKYRELLREEIAQTVSGPEEVDEEIRSLFRVLQT